MITRRHRFLRPNRYDHFDRRVQKITPAAAHTFFYDGWLLTKEIVANTNGTTDVIEYHWGKDLSGTIGGAGGVGGLLYLSISNSSISNSSTPNSMFRSMTRTATSWGGCQEFLTANPFPLALLTRLTKYGIIQLKGKIDIYGQQIFCG